MGNNLGIYLLSTGYFCTMAPVSVTREKLAKSKRKREPDNEDITAESAQPSSSNAETSRKKKKRKKAKKPADDVTDAERKDGIDASIGKMDGKLLADHLAQKAKRHNKDLTEVELNDIYVPGRLFATRKSSNYIVFSFLKVSHG